MFLCLLTYEIFPGLGVFLCLLTNEVFPGIGSVQSLVDNLDEPIEHPSVKRLRCCRDAKRNLSGRDRQTGRQTESIIERQNLPAEEKVGRQTDTMTDR